MTFELSDKVIRKFETDQDRRDFERFANQGRRIKARLLARNEEKHEVLKQWLEESEDYRVELHPTSLGKEDIFVTATAEAIAFIAESDLVSKVNQIQAGKTPRLGRRDKDGNQELPDMG